ncbi:hypothetical protein [Kibdelosporangium phytohabitans]|uniref:HSP18 transcriptional regulator n=1 Tax=Kibdelosporangium phytohabitans TaxID=860235 RepID=A0A0N9HXV0_9PSEU|nr:hypothetical protein [Kibdelosporangium phytohabitans]ALG08102.1 hypothetical protein AOZ06_15295 [Kibdelosporangium phytohabitans]MBE1470922.1 hypothetical protein [Kibdelosporangium phytohabitans]
MDGYDDARRLLGDNGWNTGASAAADAMNLLQGVAEGGDKPTSTELLAALVVLRRLREDLARWEPELITAARGLGTSWAAIAPALGLASRQAAERRYLRLSPLPSGTTVAEQRVREVRDQRAADRAVSEWARENAAVLRQLAGQVIGLPGPQQRKLTAALAKDDPTALLAPLAAARERLRHSQPALVDRIEQLTAHVQQLRDASDESRAHGEPR